MNKYDLIKILNNALAANLKGKLLKRNRVSGNYGYYWTIDKSGDREILDARIEIYEFDWRDNNGGGTEDCLRIEALIIFNRKETWVSIYI